MNINAMNLFLSDSSIKRHFEHLREERLRYSILEKSCPELKGRSISEIVRLNISKEIKDEAVSKLRYIKSHECFFNSFAEHQVISENTVKQYKSKERLLYEIYSESVERNYGFMYIYLDKQGNIKWSFEEEGDGSFLCFNPVLALDLFEHTYFLDYGFEKKLFLRNALAYLNLSSLDKKREKGYN